MITVSEAIRLIEKQVPKLGTERISLHRAYSRVLAEDWCADRDLPPYDRVTMDGIGINFQSYDQGQRTYRIVGIGAAGMPQLTLTDPTVCLEVMTGGVRPEGADTIIRYEDLNVVDGYATIDDEVNIRQGQNVHQQGYDRKSGELIVKAGTCLSAAEIGIGADLGKAEVLVIKQPKIMVVSTGDELVEIDQEPAAHQIRKSNVYRIESTLKNWGLEVETSHLADDENEIRAKLEVYIKSYDVLILSGGVSKGKFDFLPKVLEELGIEKHFHGVAQRPGKPFWFGSIPSCTVFALPGNPISSFLCTHKYFKQWLWRQQGRELPEERAVLTEAVSFKPDLTYFLEVKLRQSDTGILEALPCKGNGSGDMANLVRADAFIELPKGLNEYPQGGIFHIYRFR